MDAGFMGIKETKKAPVPKPVAVKKDEVEVFDSYLDFIHKKLTIGGMLNWSVELSDKDLKILKRLIVEELAKRKGKK